MPESDYGIKLMGKNYSNTLQLHGFNVIDGFPLSMVPKFRLS